jgi:hypothetical protein
MSSNDTNPTLRDLASQLHNTFVANHWAHAEQLSDGSYNTVHKPLSIARIHALLLNGESCLTYQLSSGALRWICFDVDIKREVLTREDYATVKGDAQMEVVQVASLLCAHLTEYKVPHLLEFSGNRGAHVWVIWKEFVDQSYGYALQQKLLEVSQALLTCSLTTVDRFPQTPRSGGKLGKGVKLPLSKHKKSGFYSCLVTGPQGLENRFSAPFAELETLMIREQSEILESFIVPTWSEIAGRFALDAKQIEDIARTPAYIRQTIKLSPGQAPTLDSLLDNLASCALLRPVIARCTTNEQLSEKERAILVGLLGRLRLPGKKDFGKDLLFELFSKQPNFKPNVTTAKLSNLNLYTPTCSYLSQAFGLKQESCEAHASYEVHKTPLELLENCEIEEEALFALPLEQFEAIRSASLRYAEINDEIDLQFLRMEIQRIDATASLDSFPHYLSHQRTIGPHYIFERPEAPDRVRILVSLCGYDAVLSAWFTKILAGLFGSEISAHSYGYRFEPSLSHSNLFKPWFPQWIKYTTALSRIIEDDAFDDYWVIKLDIRSFYDQIPLARLRVKLGTGPSRACGITLQSLDQESRRHYETICSTLVEWCRVISGGDDRGVPQGPAFARYLAELYLLQFDQDIEELMQTHQAQYFRWVDDVFLIAPNKASAQTIDRIVRGEIEALSLEVNDGKAFLGTIRDYRMRFHEYKNDSKYFVDQVSRNARITSTSLNAQAREILSEMIEGPDGVGLRPENASFFLTHLKTAPKGAAEFVPQLLKVELGRGSFFKHLFDYIAEDLKKCEFLPDKWELTSLSGFRLEVFLNSLLWKVHEEPLTTNASDNLLKILTSLQRNAKSRLAKSLLIHLMLNDAKLSDNIEFDQHISVVDLIQCLHQRQSSEIGDKILNRVLEQLTSLPIEEAIELLHILVIDNPLSIGGYRRSSDKFFALVLENLEQGINSSSILTCLRRSQEGSGELLRKYHMLCCICFVTASAKNSEEFRRVWYTLVILTNELPTWNPGKAHWLEKAESVEINHANISVLFAAGLGGDGVCPGTKDKHNIFEEYHYHLVVFLFAMSNPTIVASLPSKTELLDEANKHGMLYLVWLLNPSDRVELYPNKKMCLRNIVENELTILKRENQLLVRYSKERGFVAPPPFPRLIASQDETSRFSFTNSVFEFPSGAMELDKLIRSKPTLSLAIRLITQIYKNLRTFRDTYVGNTRGVPNVFSEGFGILGGSLIPAISATAMGAKLLIAKGTALQSKVNDLATAWSLLLERIETSTHNLLPYNHYAQVTAASIKTLLPLGTDSDEQVAFLEILYRALPIDIHAGPFEIDHSKLEAAARFSELIVAQNMHSSEKRVPTLFGKTMDIYLSITGERVDFAKRMSFTPIESPSDKSLGGLLSAILASLAWTTQHAYLGNGGIDLLKSIELEFVALAKTALASSETEEGPLPDGAKAILDQAKRAVVEPGDDYELIIDEAELISSSGDVVATPPVTICRFGGHSRVEEPLRPQHSAELRRSLVYSVRARSKTIVFLTDDIVRTVFEVIRKRSEAFFGSGRDTLDPAILECLEDRTKISKPLRSSPNFNRACDVVRSNHFTSEQIQGEDDCERVLLRWLEQFEASEASVLLEVIAAHQRITENSIKAFVDSVANRKTDSIVFSTKRLSDQGGVHRLFTLTQDGQEIIRSLDLDSAVSKIADFKGGDETLIILAEAILSGSQLEGNFKKHYLSTAKGNEAYIQQQRLFEIEDFKDNFVRGMKCFRKILILAAVYTQRGVDKIRTYLSAALEIPQDCIEVVGALLNDSACFLGESEEISAASKDALRSLLSDMKRIKSLFQVENETTYTQNLHDFDHANLIVRPNSVPKKGLKIFTLPPRNRNIPPLFRKTEEHQQSMRR